MDQSPSPYLEMLLVAMALPVWILLVRVQNVVMGDQSKGCSETQGRGMVSCCGVQKKGLAGICTSTTRERRQCKIRNRAPRQRDAVGVRNRTVARHNNKDCMAILAGAKNCTRSQIRSRQLGQLKEGARETDKCSF